MPLSDAPPRVLIMEPECNWRVHWSSLIGTASIMRLNPGAIMIIKVIGCKLSERLAQSERTSPVRVRLAEVKTEACVVHAVISSQCSDNLCHLRRHRLDAIHDIAQMRRGIAANNYWSASITHGPSPAERRCSVTRRQGCLNWNRGAIGALTGAASLGTTAD